MRVLILSLGCSKNLVDSENIAFLIQHAGHQLVDAENKAEAVIVQTCSFVKSARIESKQYINRILELKKKVTAPIVLVTGCWVQHYREKLVRMFPQVDCFIGTGELEKIVEILGQPAKIEKKFYCSMPGGLLDIPVTAVPELARGKYAYVRIAEGCNSGCSFCVIPRIRGKHQSRKIEAIVKEVTGLAENGVREINLVSQNTAYYGYDLYGRFMLPELLKKLCRIKKLEWIRLLYTDLKYCDKKLINVIAEEKKVCHYLDIPLQHINNKILLKMRRGITKEKIIEKLNYVRERVPDMVLRTTFIVGFPGETKKEFQELLGFVKQTKFDHLGCFVYSKEDGTPAAKLCPQVPGKVKQERKKMVMLQQQKNVEYANRQKIGKMYKVMIEQSGNGMSWGRTQEQAPEVDNRVYIKKMLQYYPAFVKCKITGYKGYDLIGEII